MPGDADAAVRRVERTAWYVCVVIAVVALVLGRGRIGPVVAVLAGGALVGLAYWTMKTGIANLMIPHDGDRGAPVKAVAKAVERGKAVFAEQKCSLCHSVAGKGNPKGALDDVGTKLTGEQIRQWLLTPKEMAEKDKATRKPPMQPYTKLTKTDLDALVAFLQTLKKK